MLQLNQNLTPVYTGFTHLVPSMPSLTCNSGTLLRALMLLLTLACPSPYSSSSTRTLPLPTSSLSSFFRHMLTTESSLASLCIPSATSISFPFTLPFLLYPLAAPLARPLVPHVWTMGDRHCLGPRDILIWGHLEGKGKEGALRRNLVRVKDRLWMD